MEGARLLALDRLAAPGARDLLVSRLGWGRIAGEPGAAGPRPLRMFDELGRTDGDGVRA